MIRRKLVIDTDPGIDDAIAVIMAMQSPELDVIALTTVFGNASVEETTRNAHTLIDAAERPDVRVISGASAPLARPYAGAIPHIHGADGLGDGGISRSATPASQGLSAAEFICQEARKRNGTLSILALGPLTNLALALRLDSDLQDRVESLTIMGGNAFCPGNASPCAEANMLGDPEAADVVLGARWPVTLVGLDVTQRIRLNPQTLERICSGTSARSGVLRSAIPLYKRFYLETNGIDGILCHDPAAVAMLLRPGLFQLTRLPIRVETAGLGRGKTWPDVGGTDHPAAEWRGRPSVSIAVEVDADAVESLVVERLAD